MIVKICGITNPEDAAAAIAGGATAIGFNFYQPSPRYIMPEWAARIVTPPGVRRVGVFVNEPRETVERIVLLANLDVAQLHGDETQSEYPAGTTVWKAMRVTGGFDFGAYRNDRAEALLLDGPAGDFYGGAGQAFDWYLAAAASCRVIVAGGLDASNVAAAVALAHPWGVDACSRIESAPGKKDHKKMNDFLQAAREALHL
ncbi:N-(5'-phosphoribosyl)anthranilate isomerase [Candidatus Sulfopaludibacter sp. SbA3]|nr:N-(5'-phosphoribosyl)anthranilate isomerase [Candidatus Sulfopaludibacter sp. SbA3]